MPGRVLHGFELYLLLIECLLHLLKTLLSARLIPVVWPFVLGAAIRGAHHSIELIDSGL